MNQAETKTLIEKLVAQADREVAAQIEATSKPWWESRTIWGAVIVLVAQVALMFGVAVDVSAMTESVLALATLIGAILAWWGRLQADRPVSRTRVLPHIDMSHDA